MTKTTRRSAAIAIAMIVTAGVIFWMVFPGTVRTTVLGSKDQARLSDVVPR